MSVDEVSTMYRSQQQPMGGMPTDWDRVKLMLMLGVGILIYGPRFQSCAENTQFSINIQTVSYVPVDQQDLLDRKDAEIDWLHRELVEQRRQKFEDLVVNDALRQLLLSAPSSPIRQTPFDPMEPALALPLNDGNTWCLGQPYAPRLFTVCRPTLPPFAARLRLQTPFWISRCYGRYDRDPRDAGVN